MHPSLQRIQPALEGRQFLVKQVFEIGEHFGFETRNKYQVLDPRGNQFLFVAEQQKGVFGFLFRQWGGHRWRPFTLHFFDNDKKLVAEAHHPFRWFFQKLDVRDRDGRPLGHLQKRFSILRRKIDVLSPQGGLLWNVRTRVALVFPIWKYPFFKKGREVAVVNKKFSGVFSEFLTDRDNFVVDVQDSSMTAEQKLLLIASAIFFDVNYFEVKK